MSEEEVDGSEMKVIQPLELLQSWYCKNKACANGGIDNTHNSSIRWLKDSSYPRQSIEAKYKHRFKEIDFTRTQ